MMLVYNTIYALCKICILHDKEIAYHSKMFRIPQLCPKTTALIVTKRLQQTTPTSSSKSSPSSQTKTASSDETHNAAVKRTTQAGTTTTQADTTTVKTSGKTDGRADYPADGGNRSNVLKMTGYALAIGVTTALVYAEYENGKFRRKVEKTIPLSGTLLGGLDKIIDPVFGRRKNIIQTISDELPDMAKVKEGAKIVRDQLPEYKTVKETAKDAAHAVYEQLPEKKTVQKTLAATKEGAKDVANAVYEQLPEKKTVQKTLSSAKETVKDAANAVYEQLPEKKTVKDTLSTAKDQLKQAATTVQATVKDNLPTGTGRSGDKTNDPMFLDEPGAPLAPPPVPSDKKSKLK
ncbi:unnamed protein product [Didymodactylos carnosus]|uniref:Uncharacterized protein n=1 Tax=Didymodactylos carnosus TaxID=1234261 RepID=A0A814BSR0_9BILA|nr:unnamed protein product [Didymodactylos carnosus]CAF0930275.1 unnamed protein product [Didymodactylos carnosus]CAF3625287.1 unnamed protein product [Didymodactylos carnosus]CAF3708330.1 unnamed protein product [Didymodactylos carnosus]